MLKVSASSPLDFTLTLTPSMGGMTNTAMSPAADSLLRLLDVADAMLGAAELRARSYDLLRLSTGGRVVDVGCGAGRAVAELSQRGVGLSESTRMSGW